jgi:hypothetical protein
MARLTRKNIKVFAGNATNNGVFGSLQAENPVTTNNVEQIQSLPAWSVGWNSATMTSEKLPPLEEFQGIQYVTTYQQAYIMQEGLPEWASSVTYYKGSLVKEVTANGFKIYNSLTDENTNNLLSDTSNWVKVMDSSDLYAFDNAVVHLAGDETITGTKTFTSDPVINENTPQVLYANTQVTKGQNPSASKFWTNLFYESAGREVKNRLGELTLELNPSGDVSFGMSAYKNEANSTSSGAVRVTYPSSGTPYATAPHVIINPNYSSSLIGKIVTTIDQARARNGAYVLGNGLIIQWGHCGGSGTTVTLPRAFTTTNYSLAFVQTTTASAHPNTSITDKTTTTFKVQTAATSQNDWVAIGY